MEQQMDLLFPLPCTIYCFILTGFWKHRQFNDSSD